MVSRFSADRRAELAWARGSGGRRLSTSRPSSPITPFSGVLISWLMLARNSDLARLAASASCLAWLSVPVSCSSSRRERLLCRIYQPARPAKPAHRTACITVAVVASRCISVISVQRWAASPALTLVIPSIMD